MSTQSCNNLLFYSHYLNAEPRLNREIGMAEEIRNMNLMMVTLRRVAEISPLCGRELAMS